MRRLYYLVSFICSIVLAHACNENKGDTTPVTKAKNLVQIQLDSLQAWLTYEFMPLVESSEKEHELRAAFLKGRRIYKKVEWGLEYFYPSTAKSINGAPLPEIEYEEHQVTEPSGFQVIEEHLFPNYEPANKSDLLRETKKLESLINRAQTLWSGVEFRDDQVFHALRLQLVREITLGISGFDNPVALRGIEEVEPALKGIKEALQCYGNNENLNSQIDDAILFASNSPSFNEFNRIDFITDHINPISREILKWQNALNIPVVESTSALRESVETIFDEGAFDVNFFTPDINSWVTPEKIALGRKLFYDPILSESMKISCASCHKPEKAFSDGLAKSVATGSRGFLARNTPSLINAGYQNGQFYDMRAVYLEDQVKDVIQNKDEVHGSLEIAAERMNANVVYKTDFKKAFPEADRIEPNLITIILASYVRSLSGFRSDFDLYMRGDKTKMSDEEKEGFNLFMGKAKCGTCHFMPLFNGTVPPAFNASESEVLGVPARVDNRHIDSDPGRYGVYKIPEYEGSFKTPTVRNASVTAPYMHNGVYQTLEQVMDFYNKGGGRGLGFDVKHQTLPEDPLDLTEKEQKNIISFLETLTDTTSSSR